jgi:hypothetical protein
MAEYDQESQSGPLREVFGEDETEISWMLHLSDKNNKYWRKAYREGVDAFQKFLILFFT